MSDLVSPLSSSAKVRSSDAAVVFNAVEAVALAVAHLDKEAEEEEEEERRKKR